MGSIEGPVIDPQRLAGHLRMVEGLDLAAVPRAGRAISQNRSPFVLLTVPGDAVPAAHQLTEDGAVVFPVHDPKDPEESQVKALIGKGREAVEVGVLPASGHPAVIELVRDQDQLGRGPVLETSRGADGHRTAPVSPHRSVELRIPHIRPPVRVPEKVPHISGIGQHRIPGRLGPADPVRRGGAPVTPEGAPGNVGAEVEIDHLVPSTGVRFPGGMDDLGHMVQPGPVKEEIVVPGTAVLDQAQARPDPAEAIPAGGVEVVAIPVPDVIPDAVTLAVLTRQDGAVGGGAPLAPGTCHAQDRIGRMLFQWMPGPDDTPPLLDQVIVHQELPGSRQVAQKRFLSGNRQRSWNQEEQKKNRNQPTSPETGHLRSVRCGCLDWIGFEPVVSHGGQEPPAGSPSLIRRA